MFWIRIHAKNDNEINPLWSVNFWGDDISGKSWTLKPDCRTIWLSVWVGVFVYMCVFFLVYWMNDRPTNQPNIILKSTQIVFFLFFSFAIAPLKLWSLLLTCMWVDDCVRGNVCAFLFSISQFYCFCCFCFHFFFIFISCQIFDRMLLFHSRKSIINFFFIASLDSILTYIFCVYIFLKDDALNIEFQWLFLVCGTSESDRSSIPFLNWVFSLYCE